VLVSQLADRGLGDLDGVLRGTAQDQHPREDLGGERALEPVVEQLASLAQMLAGGGDADMRLHGAELEKKSGAILIGGPFIQCAGQIRSGTRWIAATPREASCLQQNLGHPTLATRCYREEVARDDLGCGAEIGKRPGGALVLECALRRRKLVIHGVAHERVHEAEWRLGPQDLCCDEPRVVSATLRSSTSASDAVAGGSRRRRAQRSRGRP
jgi:hypothetical protein